VARDGRTGRKESGGRGEVGEREGMGEQGGKERNGSGPDQVREEIDVPDRINWR